MNIIEQAGIRKKSFELNYDGGTIWCEHLDSMGSHEQEVIRKITSDYPVFSRPSVSSYMIISLDETEITDPILDCLRERIAGCPKVFRKIAFVGVEKRLRRRLASLFGGRVVIFFTDEYEKAKEGMWKD